MLNSQEYSSMLATWGEFIKSGKGVEKVRPLVAESWKRCRSMKVSAQGKPQVQVSGEKLEQLLEKNKLLLNAAMEVISPMEDILGQTHFMVILCNSEGIVLHVYGSGNDSGDNPAVVLKPGVNMSEEVIGTNGVGLALKTRSPVQIYGPEHYNAHLHSLTCAASPIFDQKWGIAGVLNITGPCQTAHEHTLGMVISLAKAIEKELYLHKADHHMAILNEFFCDLTNTKDSGLIAFNENGQIIKANAKAIDMLRINTSSIARVSFNQLFENCRYEKLVAKTEKRVKTEAVANVGQESQKFNISLKFLWEDDECLGSVCRIKKHEQWDDAERGEGARYTFADIIGEDTAFRNCVYLTKKAAQTDSKIVLMGESGTGKEMFAQAIHNYSKRRHGPFIAINCSAIPRELLESEMFGYEEGAFTGARKGGMKGKFELASGGTLFLDEIGDMPFDLQAKLLRALEASSICRVGGSTPIPIDCRIIAATNKDLQREVEEKKFRDDLYYRLAVFTIHIPPLRDRKEDIPHLINHFLYKISRKLNCRMVEIDPEVMERFYEYSWPGNIRELENVIERSLLLCDGDRICLEHLPPYLQSLQPEKGRKSKQAPAASPGPGETLKKAERQAIIDAIKEAGGNLSRASAILGIARNTLYRKIKMYNISTN